MQGGKRMPRKPTGRPLATREVKRVQPTRPSAWRIQDGGIELDGIGNKALLHRNWLGLVCSVQCPGSVVIKTFDAIRELRDAGVVVAGGFHSPVEKECMDFLMRGSQPVVAVQARHLGRPRFRKSWRSAIERGRLLVLAPFDGRTGRVTKASAQARNEYIASRARAVLIPHASPGGQAEAIADYVIRQAKPLFTLEAAENAVLFERGARQIDLESIKRLVIAERAPD